MICLHCVEAIEPGDQFEPVNGGTAFLHIECMVRVIQGSAAHQLHECRCFGGNHEDPAGMTHRQAARLAFETFAQLQALRDTLHAPPHTFSAMIH